MIVAGIVTFEPEIERFTENLASISAQVRHVFVYDNGSANSHDVAAAAESVSNCSVILSATNDGIARALNQLAEAATDYGAKSILTLDQDSVAFPNMVQRLSTELVDRVGMVTPYIIDRNKQTVEEFEQLSLPLVEEYRQPARKGAITSGALLTIAAWREVGGFDERFFIDYVDYDLNQRLMDAGFKILRVNTAALLHEVGQASPTWLKVPRKDLAGHWHVERFYSFGHSPSRCYYKARNRILFTRKHGRRLGLTHEGAWQIPQQVLLTFLFERNRFAKLSAFLRGVRDGIIMPLA